MADTKISALTGASTPLAGTEVVPVVQSSTTKKVSIADLTAGRAVSTAALTTTGKLTTSFAAGGGFVAEFQNTTSATPYCVWVKDAATPTAGYPLLYVSDSTGATSYFRVDSSSGDATLGKGNLVIGTSGKGIDFSSTANSSGTMTSELLSDYEQGTWTPTLLTSSTNFTSVTYDAATGGRYTKIGNVVHIQGYIRTDAVTVGSASGDVLIGGLPFTSVANSGSPVDGNSSLAISRVSDWAVNQPSAARVNANSTRIELYTRLAANGASSNMAVADVATGADDNTIYFAGTYVAA